MILYFACITWINFGENEGNYWRFYRLNVKKVDPSSLVSRSRQDRKHLSLRFNWGHECKKHKWFLFSVSYSAGKLILWIKFLYCITWINFGENEGNYWRFYRLNVKKVDPSSLVSRSRQDRKHLSLRFNWGHECKKHKWFLFSVSYSAGKLILWIKFLYFI